MKTSMSLPSLALALCALAAAPCMAAPGAVYQKTGQGEVIELTNIDDGNGSEAPLVADSAPNAPAARAALPAAPVNSAAKGVIRKRKMVNGVEEPDADNADSENADVASRDSNDRSPEGGGRGSEFGGVQQDRAASGQPTGQGAWAAGGGGGAGGGAISGGSSGGAAAASSSATAGATASTGASGSSASTGNTGAGNTGTGSAVAGNTAGSSATGSAGSGANGAGATASNTVSLESMLQRYRQLMVQSGMGQDPNPAVTRRYLQVDRGTYRGMLGL